MNYLVISFTHKNTEISTREMLSFGNDVEKDNFLRSILKYDDVKEAIILSTCNRIELIANVENYDKSTDIILKLFSQHSGIEFKQLKLLADIYDDESAVHHIFMVASSLDSLVVGETQIAGQLKDAYKFALDKKYASQKLSRVIHYAFKCAARVRNVTSLGTGSVSVASAAVAQAKTIFKETKDVKALVVGAGEMSELACRHLLKAGFNVVICSRNIKKARVLAHSIIADGNGNEYEPSQIEVKPYEQLQQLLNSMRLLITATSAPYPIITKDMVDFFHQERYWRYY